MDVLEWELNCKTVFLSLCWHVGSAGSQVCLDLVKLLHFLSRSPLGSVALLDFQPRQFVTVSGSLKLTDLDDASAAETPCRTHADCGLQFPHRNFTLPCSSRGVCEDLGEKRNIYNAYR